ncbi:MAG: hypothetical protein Ct9H90mP13_13780 [Pseudomonadota bacterium]|nr:MAG: hypothetical protein Ct9H90mP13_13780 [Pseudomonadota bacterium]
MKNLTFKRIAKEPLVTYAFSVGPEPLSRKPLRKISLIQTFFFAARDADIIKT